MSPGGDVPDRLVGAFARCVARWEAERLEAVVFGSAPAAAREDLEHHYVYQRFIRWMFIEQLLEHWLYGPGALDYLAGHGCRFSDVRERAEAHFGAARG